METKLVKIDAAKPDAEKITAAAALIDEGALIAFPTETVYGIGCRVPLLKKCLTEKIFVNCSNYLHDSWAGRETSVHVIRVFRPRTTICPGTVASESRESPV